MIDALVDGLQGDKKRGISVIRCIRPAYNLYLVLTMFTFLLFPARAVSSVDCMRVMIPASFPLNVTLPATSVEYLKRRSISLVTPGQAYLMPHSRLQFIASDSSRKIRYVLFRSSEN